MSKKAYILILAAIVIAMSVLAQRRFATDSITDQVEDAFRKDDFDQVVELAENHPNLPHDEILLWRIGLAYSDVGQTQNAVQFLEKAAEVAKADSDTEIARSILLSLSDLHERQRDFPKALSVLNRPSFPPNQGQSFDAEIHRRKARLLDRMGRRFEANWHHLQLVQHKAHEVDDLILLGCRQDPFVDADLESVLKGASDAANPYRLSQALIAFRSGRLPEAADLLAAEIQQNTDVIEAHALLGLVLIDRGEWEALPTWNKQLPFAAQQHPDVWYVRGVWAESIGRSWDALHCFHRALSLDSQLPPAIFRLMAMNEQLPIDDDLRTQLTLHLDQLKQYPELCKQMFFQGPTVADLNSAIAISDQLFRSDEAAGWQDLKSRAAQRSNLAGDAIQIRKGTLGASRTASELELKNPIRRLLTVIEGLPDWQLTETDSINFSQWKTDQRNSAHAEQSGAVSFTSQLPSTGMDFVYDNGTDRTSGLMIQQSMGGGVAVIDYDCDLWPDLFFPQGARVEKSRSDGLLRNRRGTSFDRVEITAGCEDFAFSHGAAVGDFNQDGFPDFVVANSGRNHVYFNNGDGTFSDKSGLLATNDWSISAAIADLNGDSMPDLFEVNYLAGDAPFTEVCLNQELQEARTCPPEKFEGSVNEIYLNDGAGAFRLATSETGLEGWTGKSLGIIVANLDDDRSLDLFIANDQVPNELLHFTSSIDKGHDGQARQFTETALQDGLAYNGTGEALACMGIASGDINHDGATDLYVTNFYRQENTLYENLGAAGFRDITREARLREPTLTRLGFGTQFLDANLNGEQDLIVGNGHLDDFIHQEIPYAMPPQFFINSGDDQFRAFESSKADVWFEEQHLTRGIAKLDWNRDGRPDFVASQIKERAALLTNRSTTGSHLSITLRGTDSERDAVGAVVKLRSGPLIQFAQVTAGDGYASSNQKCLLFGLNGAQSVDELTVTWPSGSIQQFDDLSANQHLLIVESHDQVLPLPNP